MNIITHSQQITVSRQFKGLFAPPFDLEHCTVLIAALPCGSAAAASTTAAGEAPWRGQRSLGRPARPLERLDDGTRSGDGAVLAPPLRLARGRHRATGTEVPSTRQSQGDSRWWQPFRCLRWATGTAHMPRTGRCCTVWSHRRACRLWTDAPDHDARDSEGATGCAMAPQVRGFRDLRAHV